MHAWSPQSLLNTDDVLKTAACILMRRVRGIARGGLLGGGAREDGVTRAAMALPVAPLPAVRLHTHARSHNRGVSHVTQKKLKQSTGGALNTATREEWIQGVD